MKRTLIIGTYLPRQCGIATFSHDLYKSLVENGKDAEIMAISNGTEQNFPNQVVYSVSQHEKDEYLSAGDWINQNEYDCCIVQHEFGIFGGSAGDHILSLLERLSIPIISNLHTVLDTPSADEKRVIMRIAELSSKITVMTDRAIRVLMEVYQIPRVKIKLIPHGVPDFQITAEEAKEYLGLEGKTVMLSFGLLGRSKGYEVAIDAVSKIKDDNFLYIILGATHPNVLLHEGESYKNELIQQAAKLGLSGKVMFVNKYASDALLQIYLKACDIYVTPYPNVNQMSSGTLTFALGAGAAVLSTPYWYAKDLLADDRGCLFDFNDSEGLAECLNRLLSNPFLMNSYRNRALAYGKKMSWPNVGKQQIELIRNLMPTEDCTVVKALTVRNETTPLLPLKQQSQLRTANN